jgi:hypothetical protein
MFIYRTEYKTRDTANNNSFVQFKPLKLRDSSYLAEQNNSSKKFREERVVENTLIREL